MNQEERLKHFSHQGEDHYEEKKVEDEWYVKMYNRGTQRWQVAIYTLESFKKYKEFGEKYLKPKHE